jgi:hypothetical protein
MEDDQWRAVELEHGKVAFLLTQPITSTTHSITIFDIQTNNIYI